MLRKSNTAVVFATQSLADIVASPIVATILESCPTRIFLPNKDALDDTRTGSDKPSMKEMYQSFGLNEQQIMDRTSMTEQDRDVGVKEGAGFKDF